MPQSSTRPEPTALEICALCCARGERQLIHNLDQRLRPGEGLRVTGANGSGKTTLLRVIAGLSTDYSGEIRWDGLDTRQHSVALREQVLYVGHRPGVKAALTPLENLQWWRSLNGGITSAGTLSLADSLAAFGLAGQLDIPCARLSAGQQRRVALARLVTSRHTLWILDEPFTAVDQAGIEQLEIMFEQHLKGGGMLIISTHQPLRNSELIALDLDLALDQELAEQRSPLVDQDEESVIAKGAPRR